MSKPIEIENLEKEHSGIFLKCESLCSEVARQLQHLIEREQIQLAVPIQFRAKSFNSIADKIKEGRFTIKKSILELQDLAGFRTITLFKRDAMKIVELLSSQFEIIKQYNTEDKLQESEFGYSSIHVVCKLKDNWLNIPSFSSFKDIKFEIQVRTLSQHSWAEASNIFQYKKEDNVPKPLKRSISRISALLETVDLEFERLLSERGVYKEEIKQQSETDSNKLNVDLLEEILNQKLPSNFRFTDSDYSELLDHLIVLGYSTPQSLSELIAKHLNNALLENSKICQGYQNSLINNPFNYFYGDYLITDNIKSRVLSGTYFTQAGLVRAMLKLEFGGNWHSAYLEKLAKSGDDNFKNTTEIKIPNI